MPKPSQGRTQGHPRPCPEPGRRTAPAPGGRADPPRSIEILPETGEEHEATIEWLAHLAAGRIAVR